MNVPPWGWPWHGRVDLSNVLHLPGGKTMPYPLDIRTGEPANYTYRLKVPGVPPVERTPGELAADAALGREWRDEAILNGYNLYGRRLGGWVYCAPDDTRWIIRIDQNVNIPARQHTAVRFGVLGGAEEIQPLSVDWPTDDLQEFDDVGEIFGGGTMLVLRSRLPIDISPDGSRAIFMLYANDQTFNVGLRPLPLGFQLVTVTGVRGAITVQATTLRTMEQTLGAVEFVDLIEREERTTRQTIPEQPGTVRGLAPDRPYPDPPGTVYNTSEYWNDRGSEYAVAVGEMHSAVLGRILALWFDPTGAIIECTIDYRVLLTVNAPANERIVDPNNDAQDIWTRRVDASRRYTWTLSVAGNKASEYWRTLNNFVDGFDRSPNGRQAYWENEEVWDSGYQFFESGYTDGRFISGNVSPVPPMSANDRLYAGNYWRLISNNVAVQMRRPPGSPDPATLQYNGAATPRGVVEFFHDVEGAISTAQPNGPIMISYNPFSGEISDPAIDTLTFV